jgi:hypothetical protein
LRGASLRSAYGGRFCRRSKPARFSLKRRDASLPIVGSRRADADDAIRSTRSNSMANKYIARAFVQSTAQALPLALLIAGCSASGGTAGSALPGAGGSSGKGGAGATSGSTGSGGLGATGGSGGTVQPPDGGATAGGCTADLRSVVDEQGNVIQECTVEQGCYGGSCVPACDAAAQSKGTIGCDFHAPDPPFAGQGWTSPMGPALQGPCYAAFVANAWPRPVQIQVSRGGQTFSAAQIGRIPKGNVPNVTYDPIPASGLPPNEVAILFLSHRPGVTNGGNSLECPVPPAVLADAAVQGTAKGAAFQLTTDTPVSAYAILPFGGAESFLPSSTLLFPTTAWGTNYIAVAPHPLIDPNPQQAATPGVLWAMLVGSVAGTNVKVAPKVALPGGASVPAAPAGQVTTYSLGAGEIIQWLGADPSGAVIESDQPVALFTGSTYLHAPSATATTGGHDTAHQQIPHVRAFGHEYVGGGVVTRLASNAPESVTYRLVGVVAGTTLSWDPAAPAGAPATLDAGQVVEFESSTFFSVSSQDADHPFGFTHYMSGALLVGGSRNDCKQPPPVFLPGLPCSLGDEEWVNLVPPEQYLGRYVFFTDPTYATTSLVVTRVRAADGFHDVVVPCVGTITTWSPVGSAGKFEVAHIDLTRGGHPIGQCNVSRHELTSTGKFGVTVWGTDWFASYGYPAGGNLGSINQVHVPPTPR